MGPYADPQRIESPTLERFLARVNELRAEFGLDLSYDETTDSWMVSAAGKKTQPSTPSNTWVTDDVAKKWSGK